VIKHPESPYAKGIADIIAKIDSIKPAAGDAVDAII
jgi:hypothetical protein